MKIYEFAKTNSLAAMLRRTAVAGLLMLTALAPHAGAQTPNDITVPTPYDWPTFHAGGFAGPNPFVYAAPGGGGTSLNQAFPDSPIYTQLMGTPTGFRLLNADGTLNSGVSKITEVPSFLLGNYVPTLPPTELAGDLAAGNLTFFPSHFRDDQFALNTWSAPFTYLSAPTTTTNIGITVDDSGTFNTTTGDSVSLGAGWAQTANEATATNNEYSSVPAIAADRGVAARTLAAYTFTVPAATGAGLYTVTLHLPNPAAGQYRIPDAHYTVRRNAEVNADNTPHYLFDGRISQTETNDPQYLAGPFALAVGDTLTVTLDNSTASSLANDPVVLTDSVTLVAGAIAGGGAAVSGSPTAINSTQYPEIQDALFYGFNVTANATTGIPTQVADNTNPFGNATVGTPNTDGTHRIYQLVYFGRYETVVLTDAAGNLVDARGVASTTPVTQQVGAIYCVDGINGDIVWRFQTPDILTKPISATPTSIPSQAVFSTPSLVRVNVDIGTALAPKIVTKLVCIVADNNGLVYCLDAIGNRNGTSNTSVIGAVGTGANTYNQPIYNPAAGLNQVTTNAPGTTAIAAHVGTTGAYWIYRPSVTKVTTPNAANDLPIPQSFGLASPTVYIDPTKPIDTTTLAPGVTASTATAPPTLTSNATVYIGNSNGVLYSLDGLGAPVTGAATASVTGPDAGATGDPFNYSHYVGILSAGYDLSATATPTPKWWFSVNGTQIGTAATEDSYSITSAPAIWQTTATGTTSVSLTAPYYIYFTTANDTSNEGRVYSVLSTGPTGVATVGGAKYNTLSRPDWSFPRAYQLSATLPIRPPLGSIHGSPVVFTNPDDKTTRVYVAADANEDGVIPADQGRVWAIRTVAENGGTAPAGQTDAPGEAVWAYPETYDPNKYVLGIGEAKPPGGIMTLDGQSLNATQDAALDPVGAFDFATPAMGIVQFPSAITYGTATTRTDYVHTDSAVLQGTDPTSNRTNRDVRGQSVPMLYVGSYTEAVDGTNFLALDIDGAHDYERNTSCFGTPEARGNNTPLGYIVSAGGFQSSPLLIVNSTDTSAANPTPGNGGQVFIAGADNNLYEISATPTSDVGANSTAPQLPVVPEGGFGPFSSPAVAAFSGATLGATNTTNSAVDWVYGGDSKLGIARGISPRNFGGSGAQGVDYGSGGPGPDPDQVYIPQQFPLHAYIFDGSANHKAGDSNMGDANAINETLPAFEWGSSVYIRLSNVVPPNTFAVDGNGLPTGANAAAITASLVRLMHDATLATLDSTDPGNNILYTNGGPITVQLTDVDNEGTASGEGQTDTVTIPATVPIGGPDVPTPGTTPLGDGFLHRTGPGLQDGDGPAATASGDLLEDTTNQAWIGATTYLIGNGSNRRNTPGARRRIVSATQVAQAYRYDPTAKTFTFVSSITLNLLVNSSANSFSRGVTYPTGTGGNQTGPPTGKLQRIALVDQPTFGILNPIAVRAAGYPLQVAGALANGVNYAIPVAGTGQLGPFNGVVDPTAHTDELEAYGNGNRVPTTAPTNGVVSGGRQRVGQTFVPIIVSTGDINHGTPGDNADPSNLNGTPAVGNTTIRITTAGGTAKPAFSYGPYTLNVADRSQLGLINDPIHNLTFQTGTLDWQDNSGHYGPGAVVNPMPWETMPLAAPGQANGSQDYPNIAANTVAHNLNTNPIYAQNGGTTPGVASNLSNQPGTPDPATAHGATTADRNVYLDPVQLQIKVPQFQPANLQLFDQTQGGIIPDGIKPATSILFPQGYVSREYVFIDSNNNRRYDRGEAYRQIRVFTGVPADLSTQIQDTTVDLGRLPQSFGVQTELYTATNGAKAADGTTPLTLGLFQPYPLDVNSVYPQFFRPVNIVNKGNVNLLNVHLDQKLLQVDSKGNTVTLPLNLQSTALDSQATIPAFDLNNLGGPYGGTLSYAPASGTAVSATEQRYLLRSTLDPDLVTVYGRNPGITGNTTNNATYPGATIHKARVLLDTAPTKMTVPDVPPGDTNQPGSPYYLPVVDVPTAGSAAPPYIGLAVPLGTPVGTYALGLQAFEGLDPAGYPNIYNTKDSNGNTLSSLSYVPILPPKYGGAEINAATPATPTVPASPLTPANLNDALTLMVNGSGRPIPLQPYSNAAVIKATVTEARITNGAGKGDLPQVDANPSGIQNTNQVPSSNFLPSAFRDPGTGNVSVYWTTSPRITAATVPYSLLGANLDFSQGYFGSYSAQNWWKPINPNLLTTGVNSAISVTPPAGGNAYAFVLNTSGGGTAATQTQLLCYPITSSSGVLDGSKVVPVTLNTSQPIFGAHGLTFTGTFTDAYPGSTTSISSNLWTFWYGGARGRSSIYFASAKSSDADGGITTAFGPTAVLPIPAGLVSVSDPTAVLTFAPDATGVSIPVIEVTYTGIAADGNADIYVSRYRPYFLRDAKGNTVPDPRVMTRSQVGLALQSAPPITEQLQATDGNLWWQARDVAWARNGGLNVRVGTGPNESLIIDPMTSQPRTTLKSTYDRVTGNLVYTNVALPNPSGTGTTSGTVYVDMARGRVRFSPQYPPTANIAVFAAFNPQARRITTDSRADSAPISFIDTAPKPNEANINKNGIPDVEPDRYWFIWRKSGSAGTSTAPTLYYKTQRLTVALHDANNQPVSIQVTNTPTTTVPPVAVYKPNITVTDAAGNILYNAASGGEVDVDWARGRLYFPISDTYGALEGRTVKITGSDSNGNAIQPLTDVVHWQDEPRYNGGASPTAVAGANLPTGVTSATTASATGDAAIPIDTIVNESNVTAFLDPKRPHKVWLFWNSTRNGTADLYYETISPLFSASAGG